MYNYINEKQVYVWHDGALRQATIKKQNIYKDEEPSVKVFGRWVNSKEVYLTPSDFQQNDPAANHCEEVSAWQLGMNYECHNGEKEYYCWVCDGGRVKKIVIEDNIEATIGDGGIWVFACPTIPDKHYRHEETARGMRNYKTINEDGSEREYKGAILRVMPNEAQKDLLEVLKKAWEACHDAGLRICYDEYNARLYAYSDPDGKASIEYGGDMEGSDCEFADITNVEELCLRTMPITTMNEEYGLWIKKEEAK